MKPEIATLEGPAFQHFSELSKVTLQNIHPLLSDIVCADMHYHFRLFTFALEDEGEQKYICEVESASNYTWFVGELTSVIENCL